MKFSLKWLTDTLGYTLDSKVLLDKLTMAGLEIESNEAVCKPFTQVIIGLIERCEPHPNADKLQVTHINVGEADTIQVVCGAKNARAGIKIAVAICGAVLGSDLKIKKSKLRGVDSHGMCCSETELGLYDSSDGIIELPEDAPIGMSLREYLQLDDRMLSLSITPNRGDCLSLMGIAREAAALLELHVQDLKIKDTPAKISDQKEVIIESLTTCSHYSGRCINHINPNAQTPLWIQEKLRRSGIRSINPVVDVTNYVMLELGQPMHAYDANQINGAIHIRHAKPQETIILLNDKSVTLNEDFLIISDQQNPLAIAGIMGSKESSVTSHTQNIFLESACFNPLSIANRCRLLGFHTDSAFRFERGVDPTIQIKAISRATELLLEIVGGEPGPIVSKPENYQVANVVVELKLSQVNRLLGTQLSDQNILDLLKRLDITCVDKTQRIAKFSIPAHRRDLKIAEDLIEEVGRVLGYDNIPSTLPSLTVSPRLKSDSKKSIDQLKFQLTNLGYHEAINYSFVDSQLQQQLEPSDRCETITLKNPISKELNVMRCSLLSHLVIAARYNQNRQQPRGLLFEVGRCFYRKQNEIEQPQRIAGIRWGNHIIPHWRANHTNTDFFIIKADVEAILKNLKLQDYCFQHTTHSAFHPGRSAEIIYQGKAIGLIGELHPKLHKDLDLAHQLSYFELEIDSISVRELPTFQELSKFPSVSRDISLIVDKSVPAADIVASIRECAGEYLVGVQIFDSFCSDRFAAHKKSVAFNLVWQDKQKTLEDVTISELMENVLKFLSERFDTVLRE